MSYEDYRDELIQDQYAYDNKQFFKLEELIEKALLLKTVLLEDGRDDKYLLLIKEMNKIMEEYFYVYDVEA